MVSLKSAETSVEAHHLTTSRSVEVCELSVQVLELQIVVFGRWQMELLLLLHRTTADYLKEQHVSRLALELLLKGFL